MRNLAEIDKDLNEAREALSQVKGSTAEVYSRIVGYYRSVRNWNKGKREEYGERKLYDVEGSLGGAAAAHLGAKAVTAQNVEAAKTEAAAADENAGRLVLFVRPACPACPAAKTAAATLGIPVETVNADTDAGLAEATRLNVMSTPTAILLAKDGRELDRARDSASIAQFRRFLAPEAALKSA